MDDTNKKIILTILVIVIAVLVVFLMDVYYSRYDLDDIDADRYEIDDWQRDGFNGSMYSPEKLDEILVTAS